MMERLTIIHASVWTCAVTKRPGLTFEEAVLSEKVGFTSLFLYFFNFRKDTRAFRNMVNNPFFL
jgi:hypothetical protein